MPQQEARRWLVQGRVQGVGFRFFVQHQASSLGLSGWARNRDDGAVEVYAVGPSARLDDLAGALHTGPPMADVRSVEEHKQAAEPCSGFSIR